MALDGKIDEGRPRATWNTKIARILTKRSQLDAGKKKARNNLTRNGHH